MFKPGEKITITKQSSRYKTKNTLYPEAIYTCVKIKLDPNCYTGIRIYIKHNNKLRGFDSNWFVSAEKLIHNQQYNKILEEIIE